VIGGIFVNCRMPVGGCIPSSPSGSGAAGGDDDIDAVSPQMADAWPFWPYIG